MGFRKLYYLSGLAAVIGLGLFVILGSWWIAKKERIVFLKKQELARFDNLKKEYLRERDGISSIEKKLFASETQESTDVIMQEIGRTTGIKDKMSSFKPIGVNAGKGYLGKGGEIKIEGITLNQLVNTLYRIENHKSLLLIKTFSMKVQFNNPLLLDVNMQVALLTKRT